MLTSTSDVDTETTAVQHTSLLPQTPAGGLVFSAVNPLMRRGAQRQLQTDDLLHLSATAHPTGSTDDLWKAWQEVRIIQTVTGVGSTLPSATYLQLVPRMGNSVPAPAGWRPRGRQTTSPRIAACNVDIVLAAVSVHWRDQAAGGWAELCWPVLAPAIAEVRSTFLSKSDKKIK